MDIAAYVDPAIDALHDRSERGRKRSYLHRLIFEVWARGYQQGFDAAADVLEIDEFKRPTHFTEDRLREVLGSFFNEEGLPLSKSEWASIHDRLVADE